MTTKQLEETLTIIATKAKDLRAAGITGQVQIGDVRFNLDQPEAPPMPLPSGPPDDTSALDDPDTFGGEMPRRRGAEQITEYDEE